MCKATRETDRHPQRRGHSRVIRPCSRSESCLCLGGLRWAARDPSPQRPFGGNHGLAFWPVPNKPLGPVQQISTNAGKNLLIPRHQQRRVEASESAPKASEQKPAHRVDSSPAWMLRNPPESVTQVFEDRLPKVLTTLTTRFLARGKENLGRIGEAHPSRTATSRRDAPFTGGQFQMRVRSLGVVETSSGAARKRSRT